MFGRKKVKIDAENPELLKLSKRQRRKIIRGIKTELGKLHFGTFSPMKPIPRERTDWSTSADLHIDRLKGIVPSRKNERRELGIVNPKG